MELKPYRLKFQGPVDVGFLKVLALVEDLRLKRGKKKVIFTLSCTLHRTIYAISQTKTGLANRAAQKMGILTERQ